MLTPELFARAFVDDDRWLQYDYVGDDDYKVPDVNRDALAAELVRYIHAYGDERAAAERERCAQVAEQEIDQGALLGYGITARAIARAIRALLPQPRGDEQRDQAEEQ